MELKNRELEDITIPEPCTASWEGMEGDQQQRHCDQCNLHVINLAAMGRSEGEAVLARREKGERLCVRLEFRRDGSCITADDPQHGPRKSGRTPRVAAAALALGVSLSAACHTEQEPKAAPPIEQVQGEPHLEQLGALGYVGFADEDCEAAEVECTSEPAAPGSVMMGSPGPPQPKPNPQPK